jgi:hypothetical protein
MPLSYGSMFMFRSIEPTPGTIQGLLRQANFEVTMGVYTQAVTDVKRTARRRVARQIVEGKEG